MTRTPAPDLSPAEAARIAEFDAAPVPPEVAVETVALLLDEVRESVGVGALVAAAQREGLYCCSVGCGSGGCESCPCCCAGWCVSGLDGLPEDPEDRARWLDIAAEHNPLAAAIAALPPSPAEEALRLIDRNGCDNLTRGRCSDDPSRTRDSDYTSTQWCPPCIAAAALDPS